MTAKDRPARPERVQTQPARNTEPTRLCAVCGGHFVPDESGRRAHAVVLGHMPKKGEGD